MIVDFKFNIDQMVETVLNDQGMITLCAVDSSVFAKYHVLFPNGNSAWFRENHLISLEDLIDPDQPELPLESKEDIENKEYLESLRKRK